MVLGVVIYRRGSVVRTVSGVSVFCLGSCLGWVFGGLGGC